MYKPPNIRSDDELQRELSALDAYLTDKQGRLSRLLKTKKAYSDLATDLLSLYDDAHVGLRLDNCALAYMSLNLPGNSVRRRKLDAVAEKHREMMRSLSTMLSSIAMLGARKLGLQPPQTFNMLIAGVSAQSIRSYWTYAPLESVGQDGSTHALVYRTDLHGVRCIYPPSEPLTSTEIGPSDGVRIRPPTRIITSFVDTRVLWLFQAPYDGWQCGVTNGASFIPNRIHYFPTGGSYYSVRSMLTNLGLWYNDPGSDAGYVLKRLRLKRGGC